ncbi:hypothetical protein [Pseudoclavibacter sp. RFBB5]|uniref:hypothetical protein n=1 Tax=Pseudoclavibacter sp. RFBB5 TaxID=2080574 RepID=UPI0015E1D436|nr:hypothetical protein [Pseudoclavibacter sp. RFBB5]
MTVINATTGEVLRELTTELSEDYQPTGNSGGPTRKTKWLEPATAGSSHFGVLRHLTVGLTRFELATP